MSLPKNSPLNTLFNTTLFNPDSPYYDAKLDPDNSLRYIPNLGANIFFSIGFAFTSVILAIYLFRTWRKTLPLLTLVVASVGETIGLIARVVYHFHYHTTSTTLYTIQFVFVILSPLAIAAALYLIAGRIIRFILQVKPILERGGDDAQRNPLWLRLVRWSVSHLGLIFILSDITTLLIQAAGGGVLLTKQNNLILTGKNILLAGLILQLISFGLFCVLSFTIISLFRRSSLPMKDGHHGLFDSHPALRGTTVCLGISSTMILMRSAFRVAEFSSGFDGSIATNEGLYLGLDATPVLISLLVWCWWSNQGSNAHKPNLDDIDESEQSSEKFFTHGSGRLGRWTSGLGWPTWAFAETGGNRAKSST